MAIIRVRILCQSLVVFAALNYLVNAYVPAVFLFGDSTLDVGTNTCLDGSLSRVDKPFNGIDFPYSRSTGRFSNGFNTADQIVRLLDKKYDRSPYSFLSLSKDMESFQRKLMDGANFASGRSGILVDTGKIPFREVVPLGDQIQQFSTVRPNLTDLLGQEEADKLISNSFYVISVGSNDLFEYQNFSLGNPESFIATLCDSYIGHLKDLYNLGARKFGIISVPAIGCCPFERALNGSGGCFVEMNELAQSFYNSTRELLKNFSSEYQDVKYSLGNVYEMTMSVIDNPLTFGFTDVTTPCCSKNGVFNASELGFCTSSDDFCQNRKKYFFWDFYHPTAFGARLAAQTLYAAGQRLVSPMNFSELAAL